MSFRRNIIANYIGQLYTSVIGIVMVPLYVRYMGVEAYGLVGFYAMLQGWFMLLDMGLTPALSREAARFKGGAVSALDLRRLVRALEGVFITVGTAGMLGSMLSTGIIAAKWLHVERLEVTDVQYAMSLMAIIVVLRWVCGLYRGVITGFEHLVWLSIFNSIIATFRFVLVVPFMIYAGATPANFFGFQLAIAIVELLTLIVKTYRLLPFVALKGYIGWEWKPLRGIMQFALSAAFTSAVWVLVMQVDKLLLSGMVPLSEYAVYTMGVLVAGGITILSGPVTTAILPRLVKLGAEGDERGLKRLYRESTQLVGLVTIPIVLVLAFFPGPVITAWTGQVDIATRAAPILSLYAIGNGILVFAGFSYLLQVSRGNLSLHVSGNLIFVLLFLPMLIFAVNRYGAVGAGYAWILANLIPFIAWLPVVHHRFLKGTHLKWLAEDILALAILPTLLAGSAWYILTWGTQRGEIIMTLAAVYVLLVFAVAISASSVRRRLTAFLALRKI